MELRSDINTDLGSASRAESDPVRSGVRPDPQAEVRSILDRICGARVSRYSIPLRPPRRVDSDDELRNGFVIELFARGGEVYIGEAAPLTGFSTETLEEVASDLRRSASELAKGQLDTSHLRTVRFAIDSAFEVGAATSVSRIPQDHPRDEYALHSQLQVNALVGDSDTGASDRLLGLVQQGYRTYKIKVGVGSVGEDIERVRKIIRHMPTGASVRFDANRAWDQEQALTFLDAAVSVCREHNVLIEYIEEPLQDIGKMPALASQTDVGIALDETLRTRYSDVPAEILSCAGTYVLKPSLAGWMASQRLANMAADSGKTVVVTSAFDTGIGLKALVLFAARYGTPNVATGISTYAWLRQDVCNPRLPLALAKIDAQQVLSTPIVLDRTVLYDAEEFGDVGSLLGGSES